jgi:hypothetical protein
MEIQWPRCRRRPVCGRKRLVHMAILDCATQRAAAPDQWKTGGRQVGTAARHVAIVNPCRSLLIDRLCRQRAPCPARPAPEAAMPARTIFLARLIGLFALVQATAMILHKEAVTDAMNGVMGNRPLLLVLGLVALAAGLAMVLAHNVWSGGALPVVVTLIGWIVLIRGVLILLLPADALARLFAAVRFGTAFYVYAALALVLGVSLTWAGFRRRA